MKILFNSQNYKLLGVLIVWDESIISIYAAFKLPYMPEYCHFVNKYCNSIFVVVIYVYDILRIVVEGTDVVSSVCV